MGTFGEFNGDIICMAYLPTYMWMIFKAIVGKCFVHGAHGNEWWRKLLTYFPQWKWPKWGVPESPIAAVSVSAKIWSVANGDVMGFTRVFDIICPHTIFGNYRGIRNMLVNDGKCSTNCCVRINKEEIKLWMMDLGVSKTGKAVIAYRSVYSFYGC